MEDKKLIRKNKSLLLSCSYALVMFALWFFAKWIICYISVPDFVNQFNDLLKKANIISEDIGVILDGGLATLAVLWFIFQVIVGYLAKKEGKRQTVKGTLCVVLAIFLLIIQFLIVADDIYLLVCAYSPLFIAAVILDIICFIAIVQIIYAILKNKQIVKKGVK